MRAQVVLTPAESKKLISKAVLQMEPVKKALRDGLLVVHPSTSTYFILEELLGESPGGVQVVGIVVPRGTCISGRALDATTYRVPGKTGAQYSANHWTFRQGKPERGAYLIDTLNEMKPGDVYIKGANALDTEGKAGVLLAQRDGGTIGRTIGASRRNGFQIIVPIGLDR